MVVVAGIIVRDPAEETAPIPLSMVIDVALEIDQVKMEESPACTLDGLAVKLFMTGYEVGGGGLAVTVTVKAKLSIWEEWPDFI